jgi:stage II sporulation SpoE-like protein
VAVRALAGLRDRALAALASDRRLFLALVVLAGGSTGVALEAGAEAAPVSLLVVPVLLGALVLRSASLYRLLVAVAGCVIADVVVLGWATARPGAIAAVGVVALIAVALARRREPVGLPALRGESMLAELRDRLLRQVALPPLPAGWTAELALQSARGGTYGGDFLVAALSGDEDVLQIALVDVSGTGIEAGTRALLYSGAFGALLGAVEHRRFLPAANDYVLRQDDAEGFASAIQLHINLRNGTYLVGSAGHLPAVHFQAGRGRWHLVEPDGVLLGVTPEAEWPVVSGRLDVGDALLCYPDGVVERPGRDISVGIDKLLGEAERSMARSFEGGATALLQAVAPESLDDRALLLVRRAG